MFAKELGEILRIPVKNSLVKRIKNTPSQTKLNREQRIKNMDNAFECDSNLKNKKIILLDDIITTGSTLNACAKVLKKCEAAKQLR